MSFSVGIVGLPNVGKSTLFQAITKKQVDISNYPFCTIEPNVGIVAVPDERLDQLAAVSHSQKIVPTTIKFVDIAGLVKNANKGEGLGNQFLANIKEVDMICQVVRLFENKDIIHIEGKIDPRSDIEVINYELILKDLEVVENHLEKVKREAKSGDKDKMKRASILEHFQKTLQKGDLLNSLSESDEIKKEEVEEISKELGLLTIKPMLFLVNGDVNPKNLEQIESLKNTLPFTRHTLLADIKLELELAGLTKEEQQELGYGEPNLDQLIKACYNLLSLVTFLTTGEDETRAWTIERDCPAPKAAAKIHSDFEKKFIKADVINWKSLIESGSATNAKTKGLVRTEGKDYIIKDGDVIEFKI